MTSQKLLQPQASLARVVSLSAADILETMKNLRTNVPDLLQRAPPLDQLFDAKERNLVTSRCEYRPHHIAGAGRALWHFRTRRMTVEIAKQPTRTIAAATGDALQALGAPMPCSMRAGESLLKTL